jgi:hypothetical protein
MFIHPKIMTFLSLEENYVDNMSNTSLKVQFPRKLYREFWVGIGQEFLHLSRKAMSILLPFTTSYLCKSGFSVVAAIKTKYHSVMNLENDLEVTISKQQSQYKLGAKRRPHLSH